MKSIHLSTALLGSFLAVGCASGPDSNAQRQAPGEVVYRTGSNIPVRDTKPLTKEEKQKQAEDSQRSLQQMQTTGAGAPKL